MSKVSRITKHKKPLHQLYQPGFNDRNSCWLEGTWITLDKAEWLRRKVEHERMYGKPDNTLQHHNGPPIPPEKMTKAQRQAWEHFAGCDDLYVAYPDGRTGIASVDLSGRSISGKSLKWLRKTGIKALPKCQMGDGEVIDQIARFSVPPDLVAEVSEQVADPWMDIVKQNKQNLVDTFKACAEEVRTNGIPIERSFPASMALEYMVMQEETVVQEEWNALIGRKDRFDDPEGDRKAYAEMRKIAKEVFGDRFGPMLAEQRAEHNECARLNLDSSSGSAFCFVLPEFHDDGTHEPWGPKDVPCHAGENDDGE